MKSSATRDHAPIADEALDHAHHVLDSIAHTDRRNEIALHRRREIDATEEPGADAAHEAYLESSPYWRGRS